MVYPTGCYQGLVCAIRVLAFTVKDSHAVVVTLSGLVCVGDAELGNCFTIKAAW